MFCLLKVSCFCWINVSWIVASLWLIFRFLKKLSLHFASLLITFTEDQTFGVPYFPMLDMLPPAFFLNVVWGGYALNFSRLFRLLRTLRLYNYGFMCYYFPTLWLCLLLNIFWICAILFHLEASCYLIFSAQDTLYFPHSHSGSPAYLLKFILI